MTQISIVDSIPSERWDEFVEHHPFGWICHLSGWTEVLKRSFKHIKPHYVLLQDKTGILRAALPVYEVRSWLTSKRLVSIPFATLCDPLISTSEEMEELLEGALQLLKDIGGLYLGLRTLKTTSFIRTETLGDHFFYKHHYLELKEDPEVLKKFFHRSCVRQRISRSLRSNLSLKVGENEADLQDFYHLFTKTRQRLGLPPQPYLFLRSIWEIFSPSRRIKLLMVEHRGRLIAGLLFFKFKQRVSAEFAASDESFNELSPNHFLFWKAIQLAHQEGYEIFDFGRTAQSNETLMDFKNRWGTKVVDLPFFYYPKEACTLLQQREKSIGYRLVKKVCGNAPVHTLPYVGRFCYRHLG